MLDLKTGSAWEEEKSGLTTFEFLTGMTKNMMEMFRG